MGYGNPGVWDGGKEAEDFIGQALDEAGIDWVAVGSAYYSLSVAATEAERARAIVRTVVQAHGLDADVIEAID